MQLHSNYHVNHLFLMKIHPNIHINVSDVHSHLHIPFQPSSPCNASHSPPVQAHTTPTDGNDLVHRHQRRPLRAPMDTHDCKNIRLLAALNWRQHQTPLPHPWIRVVSTGCSNVFGRHLRSMLHRAHFAAHWILLRGGHHQQHHHRLLRFHIDCRGGNGHCQAPYVGTFLQHPSGGRSWGLIALRLLLVCCSRINRAYQSLMSLRCRSVRRAASSNIALISTDVLRGVSSRWP